MSEAKIRRHVVVRGRVQGVGFRNFVEHHALQRGLAGWVRNRGDGSVEGRVCRPGKDGDGNDRGLQARPAAGACRHARSA